MPAPTNFQIATLALRLRAQTGTTVATDTQIAEAVDTVVDLFDCGVHDDWNDDSALFTALDVLEDAVNEERTGATYVDLIEA